MVSSSVTSALGRTTHKILWQENKLWNRKKKIKIISGEICETRHVQLVFKIIKALTVDKGILSRATLPDFLNHTYNFPEIKIFLSFVSYPFSDHVIGQGGRWGHWYPSASRRYVLSYWCKNQGIDMSIRRHLVQWEKQRTWRLKPVAFHPSWRSVATLPDVSELATLFQGCLGNLKK